MPRKSVNFIDGLPKYKNITVDADIVDKLNTVADEFQNIFGFRPTISQTLRHVLKEVSK